MKTSHMVGLFVIWQVAIFAVSALAPLWLPLRPGFIAGPPPIISRLNFDGLNYQDIAQHGYRPTTTAFFPLYPLLIKFLHPLLISNISFLCFLLVFNKLLLLDYSPDQVKSILVTLLVFPTSFFLGMGYSESLFMLLVVSCFYLYRTGRLFPAVLLGSAATATRFVGIVLLPSLFLIKKSPLVLLVPVGLLVYMMYLQVTFGDPLAFVHSLSSYGEFRSQSVILLPQVYWRYFKIFTTITTWDISYITSLLELSVSIIFLVLSLWCFRKLPLTYVIYNFCVFVIPTLTGSFVSLPRYVLACFPSFILLGLYLSKSRYWLLGRLVTGLLFVVFLSLFSQGYWVS